MVSGSWTILNGAAGDGAEMDAVPLDSGGGPLLSTSLLILDRKRPRVPVPWLLLSGARLKALLRMEGEGARCWWWCEFIVYEGAVLWASDAPR